MNRNFIFVLILLVTLSMVNAIPLQKRAGIQFGKCPPIPGAPYQPDPIDVVIVPNPPDAGKNVTFTVSGTLTHEITPDYKLVIVFADPSTNKTLGVDIEDVPPTQPNTPFKVVVNETAPDPLPATYVIAVGITTLANPPDVIGCSLGLFGGSLASYPIASNPIASYPIAGADSYPIA